MATILEKHRYNCLILTRCKVYSTKWSNRYYVSEKVGSYHVLGGGRVSRAAGFDLHVAPPALRPRARLPDGRKTRQRVRRVKWHTLRRKIRIEFIALNVLLF